jgi:hypothetical protein
VSEPQTRMDVCLQVCALQWSRHEKENLSSHGFSQNQLCLWKYPSVAKARPLACVVPQHAGGSRLMECRL